MGNVSSVTGFPRFPPNPDFRSVRVHSIDSTAPQDDIYRPRANQHSTQQALIRHFPSHNRNGKQETYVKPHHADPKPRWGMRTIGSIDYANFQDYTDNK